MQELISIPNLCRDFNCKIEFYFTCFLVKMRSSTTILFGNNIGGLYQLGKNKDINNGSPQSYYLEVVDISTWHMKTLSSFWCYFKVILPQLGIKGRVKNCEINSCSKIHELPYPFSFSRVESLLHILHIDLWGPCTSINGEKFWILPLISKSNFTKCLSNF